MTVTVNSLELARTLVNALEDKKAANIVLLDVQPYCSFADYFIICSATSERQIEALADGLHDAARQTYRLKPPRIEGRASGGWVVADYGGVVIHIFSFAQRRHYALDDMWHQAKVLVHIVGEAGQPETPNLRLRQRVEEPTSPAADETDEDVLEPWEQAELEALRAKYGLTDDFSLEDEDFEDDDEDDEEPVNGR